MFCIWLAFIFKFVSANCNLFFILLPCIVKWFRQTCNLRFHLLRVKCKTYFPLTCKKFSVCTATYQNCVTNRRSHNTLTYLDLLLQNPIVRMDTLGGDYDFWGLPPKLAFLTLARRRRKRPSRARAVSEIWGCFRSLYITWIGVTWCQLSFWAFRASQISCFSRVEAHFLPKTGQKTTRSYSQKDTYRNYWVKNWPNI